VKVLAAAENEVRTEADGAAMFTQGAAVDELGTAFGERPFVAGRTFFVKLARQGELEDGVPEKLKPLVVRDRRTLFMRHRRVREREHQQGFVAKRVTEAVLECGKVGHESKQQLPTFNI
jgi:hypothetical protein